MRFNFDRVVKSLFIGALLAGAALAQAQSSAYPEKAVTLVVPYPPGNVTDVVVRKLSHALSTRMGKQVIVENRPGAAGQIGTQYVVNAKPDGYTMLLGASSTLAMQPTLYKKLPYALPQALVPVNGLFASPMILVVAKDKPYKTLDEFVQYAKKNPGSVSYGSAGVGSGANVAGEMFSYLIGSPFSHIPYKDASSLFTDLSTGRLDMIFDFTSALRPYIQKGMMVPLAVTQDERLTAYPNVPTFRERGYAMTLITWSTVMMPAGTPPEVVRKMSGFIQQALADEEVQAFMRENDMTALPALNWERLPQYIHDETEKYRAVIQRARISID